MATQVCCSGVGPCAGTSPFEWRIFVCKEKVWSGSLSVARQSPRRSGAVAH